MDTAWAHASEIAAAVCDGRASAARTTAAALARPSQTAAAISLACAQAVSITGAP